LTISAAWQGAGNDPGPVHRLPRGRGVGRFPDRHRAPGEEMSTSAAFDDLGYNAEGPEDVSFGYVPGSIGTAGAINTPWTARRRAEFDRARAECMPVIRATLSRFKATRPRPQRAPVDTDVFVRARARVLSGRGW
jgi:hypothetical protein